MNWNTFFATAKTVLIALVGAMVPIITRDGLPTTVQGWIGVLLAAGGAAGLYHMPSPSVQPGEPSMLVKPPAALALLMLLPALGLAACAQSPASPATASNTTTEWQHAVGAVQAALPLAEDAIALEFPNLPPAAVKAEVTLNLEVAALSGTTAPTNGKAILLDVNALIAALPSNVLSPTHKIELDTLSLAASALATI